MALPLDPRYAAFPIFWFPIVVPLFLSALGILGDAIAETKVSPTPDSWDQLVFFGVSSLKNVHIAYASTDIWALTTLTFAGASGRLAGWQLWAYTLATIMGLLFHMLAYLFVAFVAIDAFVFWTAPILFLIGTYGMLAVRSTVYRSVEINDYSNLK